MPLLDSLQTIEIQTKEGGKAFGSSLKGLRKMTGAFSPESCARQVMIFFNISEQDTFDRRYQKATRIAQKCTHLKGEEAYAFLLSWVVGGEYRVSKPGSKLSMFNDNHILGKFKAKWLEFRGENAESPLNRDFIQIVDLLLKDAHEIRSRMEAKSYGNGKELRKVLDIVIPNVTFSRTKGLPVIYGQMHSLDYKDHLKAFLQEEWTKLNTQMNKHPEGSPARRGIFGRQDLYFNQIQTLGSSSATIQPSPPVIRGCQLDDTANCLTRPTTPSL